MTVKEFNKRIKKNQGCDRIISRWRILDVHEEPVPFLENHEMDFYCCSAGQVLLLRIRNRKEEKYTIAKDGNMDYWIAELPVERVTHELVMNILTVFEIKIS